MTLKADAPARSLSLADADPEIAQAVRNEERRQNDGLELIASENFVSRAVLEAAGSVLTNKYAEGYPGKRYYGGCEFVDVAETLAIERAKALFGAEHANVQPHSGAQANMAVYFTLLKPGDTVLGHEPRAWRTPHARPSAEFLGQALHDRSVRRAQGRRAHRLRRAGAPRRRAQAEDDHGRARAPIRASSISRASARSRSASARRWSPTWRTSPASSRRKQHPSPVPHSDFVTTTTHKTLRGPRAGMVLCREKYAKDLDKAVFPGLQGGPLMHIIAAKAVCFKEAAEPSFVDYQKQIVANAKRLASVLVAGGFRLVSGGTDNHLMLVDVFSRGLTGKAAEAALGKAGITVNKNAIPFDPNPPMTASGIRIGTPAVTTRGMGEREMDKIGELIMRALATPNDDAALAHGESGSREAVPDVPAVRGLTPVISRGSDPDLSSRVAEIFTDSGSLAQSLPTFESRPAQRQMAEAVAGTLEHGGVLLVEAGTGTGKTLAYLVPAILSGQRVLVSTGTKNLQEQIYFKDLARASRGARTCPSPPRT